MLDSVLSVAENTITVTTGEFLTCTIASIVFGIIAALISMYKNNYSQSFIISIAMMPAVVQMVIMMVNGNIGTGIAVMGAFTLVRFRSTPGSAREISIIFLTMAIGLATGMGYIAIAGIFLAVMGILNIILVSVNFGGAKSRTKSLKVLVPESLEFEGMFEDIMGKYAKKYELSRIRTKNMGSIYEMTFDVTLKEKGTEKALIDEIRCRNGNLSVSLSNTPRDREVL